MEGARRVRRSVIAVLVTASLGLAATAFGGAVSAAGAQPPAAPSRPSASARDRSAVVSWKPPLDNGGSAITGYRLTAIENGRSMIVGAGTTSTTFIGLTNGSSYTFQVAARNAVGWGPNSSASATAFPTRPNIVFVLTDDQRWDSMAQLPNTNAMAWRRFPSAFVNEPQCCPSRSSILTGRYSHHTGVETLTSGAQLDERQTIATMLHGVGYQTALIGKYLNQYPFSRGYYTPPGWDHFQAFVGPINYFGYVLAENGTPVLHGTASTDYSTDVLTAKAVAFARGATRTRPLFLELSLNAPHNTSLGDPVPAPRDVGSCANVSFPLPVSFNAHDTVNEPTWMTGETPWPGSTIVRQRRATCETLGAVDDSMGSVLRELTAEGRLGNTYIVLFSDNGYAFGEHRLAGKGDLYESSVRVPLLVRGPGVVSGTDGRLTSNVDLAPTFADWARVVPPSGFFDGKSFAAEAAGALGVAAPGAVLLRGCRTMRSTTAPMPCGGYRTNMGMNWGLRTAWFKYVEYPDGYRQLFDLVSDPDELTNLASARAYATTLASLHNQLIAMRGF